MKRSELWKKLFIVAIIYLQLNVLFAENWPTYQHDIRRSCISSDNLKTPLHLLWKYKTVTPPKPAWAEPAKTDYWHRETNLKPRVIYDKAYHVISADGKVYFGSSADNKIYCLDANTGSEIWSFFTNAPVRLAPTYSNGLLYTGSDDGIVYCNNANTGKLIWKINTAKGKRFIPGNERIISISPIRTGVIVDKGTAYFCSGMFPNEGVVLFAVNASNGKIIWKKSDIGISPQGYLLLSEKNIYVPTGRTTPVVFSRKDGKYIGHFNGNGGTYALLLNNELIFGGGDEGELNDNYPNCKDDDQIASFLGLQIIVKGDISFLRSDNELSAIRRKKYISKYKDWSNVEDKKSDLSNRLWDLREQRKLAAKDEIKEIDKEIMSLIQDISRFDKKKDKIEAGGLLWKEKIDGSYSMILVGKSLVIGSNGKVEIFNTDTGKKLWKQKVNGIVYSLAEENGKLLVSTDKGMIYSFSSKRILHPQTHSQNIVKNPYINEPNKEIYKRAIKEILEKGIKNGYCLVVGSETGRLAYELAKHTNMKIVGIESDPSKVEKSRKLLFNAGFYGDRVSIINSSLSKLPLSKYFADLIVSDRMLLTGELSTSAEEIYRVLKPFGGVAIIGTNSKNKNTLTSWVKKSKIEDWEIIKNRWAVITRGKIKGSGEWTHLYSNPGNTSCSEDPVQGPLQIQWFGRPGPREIINRHSRPMSTLFKNGKLFIPGNNRIICVDAYNGTPLWKRYVPESRVLGALKDCGTMAVTDDYIYIAAGEAALGFNVKNGDQEITLETPQLVEGQNSKWGYLSIVDNQIFGSGKKPTASFTIIGRFNSDQLEEDYREMVMSDYVFSLDRISGKKLWSYKGVVFNNTITIGDDYLYLIESRNEKAVHDLDGRLRVDYFCDGQTYVVKLNKKTGEKEWEKKFNFPFDQIMYLAYSKGVLLVTGSYNKGKYAHYALYAFNGKSGKKMWNDSYRAGNSRWDNRSDKSTINGAHGEQWQHPVIIGKKVILPPYDFDINSGKRGNLYLTRGGGGCGGISGSASNVFARGSNPRIYKIEGEQNGSPITRVNRPGCWINIIPAGNIVSIPEASSGCTCDYPIQTSFVFVSKD
jgi:outer membrane protein assembly factor BamB/ubiquinone/menaquinone biosynthesis C-methylase UbiE